MDREVSTARRSVRFSIVWLYPHLSSPYKGEEKSAVMLPLLVLKLHCRLTLR